MKLRISLALGLLSLAQSVFSAELTREQLGVWLDSDAHDWRWHLGEVSGAERPDFDDSDWQRVDLGFKWWPHDSTGWFRTRITIPETLNGIPVRSGTIRMKAGVDNAAELYVNGALKQDFEWSKGDFILTEHARPGEIITVALHAINRPGSGSLYAAALVNGPADALVNALRELVNDFDSASQDQDYVPEPEATRTRKLVHEAMQTLDITAYQGCDRDAFLLSVEKARGVLLSDRDTVEERLKKTAENLSSLKQQLRQARDAGRSMAYATADARVVESFLKYARDDLSEKHSGHQLRGLKGAAYIERLCEETLNKAAAPERPVPRYKTSPYMIRDGAFWQNDRPVYFSGVGHFGQVREDIPILNDYGLNIIQIEMGPQNALPAPDAVDLEGIRQNVVRWLDKAAVHNVAVNLLISPHYFPKWAFDADPAHQQCGRGFIKFCIEAPNTRIVMEKWLDALMPLIAHHPALHSICLSNEPQYQGRCGYEREKFQQWLKTKWGSIKKTNQAYGTHFRRFEDVDLPKDNDPYGLAFDRWRFNQERFVVFHELLRERIHRYAPNLPVHAKVMSHAFEDPGRFEVGIDYERFTQLDRIAGNDCIMDFSGERRGEYACDWQMMAMNYTLQHSAARQNPIFNSENHLIADGDTRYIPENYVRAVFWQEAIHGQGATTTWVWERGQGGDLAENILTRANCVHAFGHVALDLQRLAPEVHALSQARGNVAIFYAYSSLLPSMDYFEEVRAAFEGAYFSSSATDFLTESQIDSGKLLPYKLIVVPRAANVPDSVVKQLNRYIHSGGTVMTVGQCFTHDEYGRPRNHGLVQSGRGQLVGYPAPLSPRAYCDIFERLLDQSGLIRPVRIEGADGEPLWGVNLRAVEHHGKLLVNLLNLSRHTLSVRLVTKRTPKHVWSLIDDKEVVFPLRTQPLEPVLLSLTQEPH